MEPEVQKRPQRRKGKSIILISLIVFSMLMLAVAAQLTYTVLKSDKVYTGVYINNFNASGMSRTEMKDRLKKEFQDKINGLEIMLKTDRITEKTSFPALEVSYGIDSAVEKAYNTGRTGNIFERLFDIAISGIKGTVINMPISYNKGKMDEFVKGFYEKTLITVKEADVLIQDDRVTVRSGRHGENIDKNSVASEVEALIKQCKGGVITAKVILTPPNKLNIDDLYSQINRQPTDAGFKVENGNTFVTPHVLGRKIEKSTLTSFASEIEKTENAERILPVEFIQPKVTTEAANAMLFKDVLATMSTHFSTSTTNDKNRGENIKLAVSKINGRILAPGDIFSFNDTVGPRTEDGGYQKAHTYTAGKVVDGIGGGICQVSTTLYNAVLKSDLKVVERRNHMFTVGYVPFGQDATVSFGTTDFKFSNSTRWPMKIEAGVTKNNNVYFTFRGTNETPGKSVIITNQTLKTIPFTIKYIDDPTLPEGKTEVLQKGMDGYVIDTFKTVKLDGKVVSQVKLYTSSYIPLEQQIKRGTKKPDIITPEPPPQVTPPPAQPTPGVDDADNPPAPTVE